MFALFGIDDLLVGAIIVGVASLLAVGCSSETAAPEDGDDDADVDRYDAGDPDLDAFHNDGDGYVLDGGVDADDGPDLDAADGGTDAADAPVDGDGSDAGEIPDGGDDPDAGDIPDGGDEPDGGGDPDSGEPPDIELPDGGLDGGGDGGVDGGDDGGLDGGDDGGLDGGGDADLPMPPGINLQAAVFTGPIADLDPAVGGGIIAYGGTPAAVYECAVNGILDAPCTLEATLPAPLGPVNYFSTPFGYAIADAAPAVAGTPLTLLRIDEAAIDPAFALIGQRVVNDVTVPGGGWNFTPTYPRGIAAYHDTTPLRDRFFVATKNTAVPPAMAVQGSILCYADVYGDWAHQEPLVISPGLNTSALATTSLNLGGGAKTYLVALNAGTVDMADAYTAGISLFDPDSPVTAHVKTISLGEVAAAALPELPLDGPGTTAYVAIQAPAKQLAKVNLVTNAVVTIPLGGAVMGDVVDIAVEGTEAYLADSSGRIVFVDLAGNMVLGSVILPAPPTALVAEGGYLYIAVGNDLIAIDPLLVGLE